LAWVREKLVTRDLAALSPARSTVLYTLHIWFHS
jgi:hypothetical protein